MVSIPGFDTQFYIRNNSDVAAAVTAGLVTSAAQHFEDFGDKELRDPNPYFDMSFYGNENPDVVAAVENGSIDSLYDHYLEYGINEDRAPNRDFVFDHEYYASENPDVVSTLGSDPETLWNHFVDFGAEEGRQPSQAAEDAEATVALTTQADVVGPNVSNDEFQSTPNDDVIVGNAQPIDGGGVITNSLNQGDVIDGGAGQDTLRAELVSDTSNVGAVPVQPRTENIETAEFNALLQTGGFNVIDEFLNDDGQSVDNDFGVLVDATQMNGVETYSSYYSQGDLTIQNITTETITKDITVRMDHTGNEDSVWGASDLTALFDQNNLLSQEAQDQSFLELRFVNNLPLAQDNLPVAEIEEIEFIVDGENVVVDVMSIGEDASLTGRSGYEALAQAIRDQLDAQGIEDVTVEVQPERDSVFSDDIEGFDQGDLAGQFNPIQLTATGKTLEPAPVNRDADQVNFDGLNTWRVTAEEGDPEPITATIELEKAGRGGEGGNLVVGGMSSDDAKTGIEVFDVTVVGDSDLPSNIASLSTKKDGVLDTINIATAAENVEDPASLTIGNSITPSVDSPAITANPVGGDAEPVPDSLTEIDASEFAGDLSLGTADARVDNLETLDATGGGDVTFWGTIEPEAENSYSYTSAGGSDTYQVEYDVSALDSSGSGIDIASGSGGDSVTVDTTGGTLSEFQNHLDLENVSVNTAGGSDTINVGDDFSYSDVDAGSGEDDIQVSDSTSTNTAAWIFNADTTAASGIVGRGNNDFNAFNISLQVEFQDIESGVVEVNSDDFVTTSGDINDAIIQAISDDQQLSQLLTTTEIKNEGLRIDSNVHRALAEDALNVNFFAPTLDQDPAVDNQDAPFDGNDTGDQFSARQSVTEGNLEQAFETYFPDTDGIADGNASNSGDGSIYEGITAAGPMHDALFDAVDYTANNMADADATTGNGEFELPPLYNKEQVEAGANSTEYTFNEINAGTGNDMVVLSSRTDGGFDTVAFDGNFGTDTILNFNTGTTGVADQLDFSSYLDETARDRGISATNPDNARTTHQVSFTFENAVGGTVSNDSIDHNANVMAGLDEVFEDFDPDNPAGSSSDPVNFQGITAAMVENVLTQNEGDWVDRSPVTDNADMEGSQFVFRIAENREIELDADSEGGVLGAAIDPLKEKVFSVEISDYDPDEDAYSFSVNEAGTIDYGDMFSDLADMTPASITGTQEASDSASDAKDVLGDDGGTTPPPEDTTPPSVDAGQSFSVAEDASTGATVGTVSASDDTGVTSFSITSGNADTDGDGTDAFSINSSGEITVGDADDVTDGAATDPFSLTVQASDAAGNTASGSVAVDVTAGLDTTAPTVDSGQSFNVAPDAADGSAVGTVSASDNVGVTNYAITGGNADGDGDGTSAFAINGNTGEITVNDTDDLVVDGPNDPFTLTVEASDAAGNTATGDVEVDVTTSTTTTEEVGSGDDGSSFDATTGDVVFDFADGGYAVEVSGFESGDVLDFADVGGSTEATLNVSNTDGSDGQVQLTASNPDQGTTVEVTLVGLSNADDSAVFNVPSFESQFGSDALVA